MMIKDQFSSKIMLTQVLVGISYRTTYQTVRRVKTESESTKSTEKYSQTPKILLYIQKSGLRHVAENFFFCDKEKFQLKFEPNF